MSNSKKAMMATLKPKSIWRKPWFYLVLVIALALLALLAYQVPGVKRRVDALYGKIYYKLNPPSAAVFNPSQQGTIEAMIHQTQTAAAFSVSEEPVVSTIETALPGETPASTEQATEEPTPIPPTATLTPYPVPAAYTIENMGLERQSFNNCGPANLSMNLNFWRWSTNQERMRLALRTHDDDRNVMLSEMRDYVLNNTENLGAILRYVGDLQVLKALVSGGYPVLLERGHTDPDNGWMGHYSIIHAYNDATQTVTSNDTLLGTITLSYDELMLDWRHFDGIYIVVFPADREQDVLERLGAHANEAENLRLGLEAVEARLEQEKGRELFFALYSKGQLLVEMGQYLEASLAFDQAFSVYGQLDMGARPWRMTWYQIGPYLAYFHTGRYQDTLTLAQQTLDNSKEPKALPETYYWAGVAAAQLGQYEDAKDFFLKALEYHPGWDHAVARLNALP